VGIWWEFGGNLKRENRKEMGGKQQDAKWIFKCLPKSTR